MVLLRHYRAGLVIILIGIFWLLEGDFKNKFKKGKSSIELLLFVILYLLYIISLLYTENIDNGLSNVKKHLSFITLPLLIYTSNLSEKISQRILKLFSYASIIGIMFCIGVASIDYFLTNEITVKLEESLYNKFLYYGLTRAIEGWHPIYVGMFLNFSWVFIFLDLNDNWRNYSFFYKSGMITAIFIAFIGIILLGSINGTFTLTILLISVPLYILFKDKKFKIAISIISIIAISGIVIFSTSDFLNQKFTSVFEEGIKPTDTEEERNALTIRLAKWESSLDVIKENPILGTGPGDTKYDLIKSYKKNGYPYLANQGYNAHNQYFEFLIAFGVLGLLLFLTILAKFTIKGIKTSNILLLSLIAIIFLAGLSESILDRQQGIMFFSFLLPILSYDRSK